MSSDPARIQTFITAWEVSGGAERGNAHSFQNELCDILEVPRPDKTVPDNSQNAYVFENTIPAPEGSKNFIDLYQRGCFVLETKQGADRDGTDPKKIRALGEQTDAHRKHQQAAQPGLTMTDMYNDLEKERTGEALTPKERKTHEQGVVGILRQLHDELDAAVAEAYGWPAKLNTDEILTRLVALNAERAAEEAKGNVRWLRPAYQLKGKEQAKGKQAKLDLTEEALPVAAALRPWPDELPAQAATLSAVLGTLAVPADVATIAGHFEGKKTKKKLEEMTRVLETLEALGSAWEREGGWVSSG